MMSRFCDDPCSYCDKKQMLQKNQFEASMLKWNKVYYYKLNDEGIYEKLRIINLVNYDSLSDKSNITLIF